LTGCLAPILVAARVLASLSVDETSSFILFLDLLSAARSANSLTCSLRFKRTSWGTVIEVL